MSKYILVLLLLLSLGWNLFLYMKLPSESSWWEENPLVVSEKREKDLISSHVWWESCDSKIVIYKIDGVSMTPLLSDGEKVEVDEGYYECHLPERWEVIIYHSTSLWDLVKQIKVLPWDLVEFRADMLLLNHEALKNSVWEVYHFDETEIRLMSIYISDGKLQEWSYFAFGDNMTQSFDSRNLGWLGVNNFVGKVMLQK